MAMQKVHSNIDWENYPSIKTPVNEQNLNAMDVSIDQIDDRVIVLDTTKFDKSEAQGLIKSLTFNRANGVFTITYYNGATATIDTMLEKLAVNFDFDEDAQQLVITLDDGTEKRVDLSAFIKPIEFIDSGTIAWQLLDNGQVSAIVKDGSIEEKHLRPNYLADIKVEVAKAQASATNAAKSETNAKASETASKTSETNAAKSETNAKASETASKTSETNAAKSEANAAASATTATQKASEATASATAAENAKNTAVQKASEASTSATNAAASAANAASSAETCTNAVETVSNAIDNINQGLPQFVINLEDGELYHTPSRFTFVVNHVTGNLDWGLTV